MKTYSVTLTADVEAPGRPPLLAQQVKFSAKVDARYDIHELRATVPPGESVPLEHFNARRLQLVAHELRRAKDAEAEAVSHAESARLERQHRRDLFIAAALPEAMREVAAGLIVIHPGEGPQHAVGRVACEAADAVLAVPDSTTNTKDT